MEQIDLHGDNVVEAVKRFLMKYDSMVKSGKAVPLEVIHGYGSLNGDGKIKKKIEELLALNSGCLRYKGGVEYDGNPGHTIVYPNRLIGDTSDSIAGEIAKFCIVPKTMDKICGEFRRHGEPAIKTAVKRMVSKGILNEENGKVKKYGTVV